MFKIKALSAYDGDCFLISYGEEKSTKNIVIDGGRNIIVVRQLIKEIKLIIEKGQKIDLMVLTHIDNDHIYGLLKLMEENWIKEDVIKEVWFNSKWVISREYFNEDSIDDSIKLNIRQNNDISFKQGILFEDRLKELKIKYGNIIVSGHSQTIGEGELKVLSPTPNELKKMYLKWNHYILNSAKKRNDISSLSNSDYDIPLSDLVTKPYSEDKAIVNSTSIAIEVKYKGKKILMLGDAHPSIVIDGLKNFYNNNLEEISYDLIKLSHHGSKNNINQEFVEKIHSRKYLISTNGLTHGLPNKETITKLVWQRNEKTKFYFNYPNIYSKIFSPEEIHELKILCEDCRNNEILEVDLWNCTDDLE